MSGVVVTGGGPGGGGGTSAPALAEGPFTYDAYGRSPQPLGTSATSTPFRYTGRRLDVETGNYYYRARFYTPTLGQFLETDPVGYADSMNLYAYVGGDPVNATDPSGRSLAWLEINDGMMMSAENAQEGSERIQAFSIGMLLGAVATAGPTVVGYMLANNPAALSEIGIAVAEMLAGDALGGASISAAAIGAGKVVSNVADAIDFTKPGRFANFSVPARGPSTYLGKSEARQFDMLGTVCHTCGTTVAGTKSGKMKRDHLPPNALNEGGGLQRLYPQCVSCMARQGSQVKKIAAEKRKSESGK